MPQYVANASACGTLCGSAMTCLLHLVEGPAVERRLLSGRLHPAPDDHVAVARVELDTPRAATGLLGGQDRGPGAAEGIEHECATLARVLDGAPHQGRRLRRWVVRGSLVARALPD